MNQHLIFSQPGVFRLQQLANLIYHQTGQRHRLSSEQGINQLLRAAIKMTQPEIRSAFEHFTRELNEHQLQQLSLHGISLPRGGLLTKAS